MILYVVQAYSKKIDEQYKTHLHPSYLTSYNMKLGGNKFGLQTGLYDALKFETEETAELWKQKGEHIFGDIKEFDIVPIDSRLLGRFKIKYIIK